MTHAQLVTVALRTPRPIPSPTPTPRATPTPPRPAPRASTALRVVVRAPAPRAAALPRLHRGGAAAPEQHARVRIAPRSRSAAPPVSLAAGTNAGEQNGGSGTGAGAGNGDGGLGGIGSGTGGAGNGTGGTTNAAPCGDIFLLPGTLSYRKDGTVVQQVLAKLVERDGTVEVDRFPYPFVYPAEKANPFRHDEAVVNADGGIPVQEPPAGADISAMPASVQIVLKYTDPKTGLTSLPACNPDAKPQ